MTDAQSYARRTLTVTAYHEAGHAVMGVLVGRLPLAATIVPDGTGMVGKVDFESDVPPQARRHFDTSDVKRNYARCRVLGELAGSIAHDILEPGRTRDAADENDDHWARQLADDMVTWEDADGYLAKARQEASSLLRQHWSAVEALAQALLAQRVMTREQILAIVEPLVQRASRQG